MNRWLAVARAMNFLSHFSIHTLAKGVDYYRRQKVLSLDVFNNSVAARVSGSAGKVYSVTLNLSSNNQAIGSSHCTCPMMRACKHCAAVAHQYAEAVKSLDDHNRLSQRPPGGLTDYDKLIYGQINSSPDIDFDEYSMPAFPEESGRIFPDTHERFRFQQNIESRFEKDMNRLSMLLRRSPERQILDVPPNKSRSLLVYIISAEANNGEPSIQPVKISLRKDGSFSSGTNVRLNSLNDYDLPPYLTDVDKDIFKLWRSVESHGSYSAYSSYSSSSRTRFGHDPELFEIFLRRILESGKCYYGSTASEPLKGAKLLPSKLKWTSDNGTTRLKLVAVTETTVDDIATPADLFCFPWKFPWYYNRYSHEIGPVKHELTTEVLQLIYDLAPIPDSEIASATIAFYKANIDQKIPPPGNSQVEIKTLRTERSLSVREMLTVDEAILGEQVIVDPDATVRIAVVTTVRPPNESTQTDASGKITVVRHEDMPIPFDEFESAGFKAAPEGLFADERENEILFFSD